jgi:DNA-binding NtrC family response regulator
MTKMPKDKGLVLVVDSDLSRATGVHNACVEAGCRTVVARDLPTALLMISQHLFSAAVFSSRVSEEGDGWSLAAVFRLIFPKAYVAVIARERSVTSLQAAINHGADELFESSEAPSQVARAVIGALSSRGSESVQ